MERFEGAIDKAKDLVKGATGASEAEEPTSGGGSERAEGSTKTRTENGAEGQTSGVGTVVEVKGPVVDVRFNPEEIPEI